ncbi:alpha/beta hydrolase [Agromyces protaetiae]|uniref:Alpha/beta hydrolase n=1 Tax=Agromyces protaetiae TaxID=2509455 RepID=A0A4V0YGX2_9MICO|nr:alpha/beta hydrolase [Agromyces protaetiae]QAY72701.1 alpha/beta hydrolase [Agromyces protaetiae]
MSTGTPIPDAATDPRIDPGIRPMLAELNKDPSPFWLLPGDQVRATLAGLQATAPRDLSGITVEEKNIEVDGVDVMIYIQRPEGASAALPVILFLHGGVWIAGDFNNHQGLSRDLVVSTGYAAVFVEYTPIPDAIYPTQLHQCLAALKWIGREGTDNGLDATRVAVVGNSVGGDLTAALSLYVKDHPDEHAPDIKTQVLLFPALDSNVDTQSYEDFAEGRFLAKDFMKFGWDTYTPTDATRNDIYAAPLKASLEQLKGLPPALILVDENDPLRDEGIAYGRRLREAGVAATTVEYIGLIHDWMLLNPIQGVPGVEASFRQVAAELEHHLG